MSKQVASNTFTEGLMKDTNPLTTPNNILTDCLNGTVITYNGSEFVLQNDMGNAIVETASLKRGYVPIGLKEYNGIIYVVSFNPLSNRMEIGSFPSPERDFNGEDFDTAEFEREGCVLSVDAFYGINPNYSTFDRTPVNNERTDMAPAGLGIEDYWMLEMQRAEPKNIIVRNSISDDFSLYPELQLSAGDRFVVYYIDNLKESATDPGNYVELILKPFLSTPTMRKLFKIEVFAVTTSGRKKLNADPLLYDKDFIYPSGYTQASPAFLNGSLDENINYSIYDYDGEGTVEVKISLEKPDSFNVRFKQYPSSTMLVKFNTNLSSPAYMQIKGFKYILNYLNEFRPQTEGYMHYTLPTLYTNVGANYTKNNILTSSSIISGLEAGSYAYDILPFTQYGYEYDLQKKGTFTVSEDYVNADDLLTLERYKWNRTTTQFELNINAYVDLNVGTQTLTDVHLEFYDVWSNVSQIIDITPVSGFDILYTGLFDINTIPRTTDHDRQEDGNIFGMPYNQLTLSTLPKLPTVENNFEGRVLVGDNSSVRDNHFYVVALYYSYHDSELNQDYNKGFFRYMYTNDVFNEHWATIEDYSTLEYDPQTVSFSLPTLSNQNVSYYASHTINPKSLLFDPLMQNCISNGQNVLPLVNSKVYTPYAIGPRHYFESLLDGRYASIDGILRNQIQTTQSYLYNIASNTPGLLNLNMLTFTTSNTINITLNEDNRSISQSGTAPVASPPLVLGVLEDLVVTVTIGKLTNNLIIYYGSNNFNIYSNKLFSFGETLTGDNITYLQPLFYQLSKEVQEKIVNNNEPESNISTRNLTLQHYLSAPSVFDNQHIELMPDVSDYILDMKDYSLWPGTNYAYGILEESGLLNVNTRPDVDDGIYISNFIDSTDVVLQDGFKHSTKRNDEVTTLGALIMTSVLKYSVGDSIAYTSQYILINTTTALLMNQALEVNSSLNLAAIFLFFGAYAAPNTIVTNYYKYYTEEDKYYYEAINSFVRYPLSNTVTLNFSLDYCYKIMMGAKDKEIVLREDDDVENLKNYILGKFAFADYSNEEFFPKIQPNHPSILLTINQNVDLFTNNGGLTINPALWNDSAITNASSDVNNHPVYFPSDFNLHKKSFIKVDLASSKEGSMLYNLDNFDGLMLDTSNVNVLYRNQLLLDLTHMTSGYVQQHNTFYDTTYPLIKTFTISNI